MADINEKKKTQLTETELEGTSGGNGVPNGLIPGQLYQCSVVGCFWTNPQCIGPGNYSAMGMNMYVIYDPSTPGIGQYVLKNVNLASIGYTTPENFVIIY